MNPILHTAVEAVTEAMARSFDEIWCRPDAAEVMDAFLGGEISFVVRCNEILVIESSSREPD